jgi:hypothetical protein
VSGLPAGIVILELRGQVLREAVATSRGFFVALFHNLLLSQHAPSHLHPAAKLRGDMVAIAECSRLNEGGAQAPYPMRKIFSGACYPEISRQSRTLAW